MWAENLAYALAQVVHNFGAVGVVGGALFALWPARRLQHARAYAWIVLAAWGAQILSGTLFGVTSLHYYGETPDLGRVAFVALIVKVAAAVGGVMLAAFYLWRGRAWDEAQSVQLFRSLVALGVVALTAAAFLRWFS